MHNLEAVEVKELQQDLINELFTPNECADALESWEEVFEKALFCLQAGNITDEYIQHLFWYYQLLKRIRQLSEYGHLDDHEEPACA